MRGKLLEPQVEYLVRYRGWGVWIARFTGRRTGSGPYTEYEFLDRSGSKVDSPARFVVAKLADIPASEAIEYESWDAERREWEQRQREQRVAEERRCAINGHLIRMAMDVLERDFPHHLEGISVDTGWALLTPETFVHIVCDLAGLDFEAEMALAALTS